MERVCDAGGLLETILGFVAPSACVSTFAAYTEVTIRVRAVSRSFAAASSFAVPIRPYPVGVLQALQRDAAAVNIDEAFLEFTHLLRDTLPPSLAPALPAEAPARGYVGSTFVSPVRLIVLSSLNCCLSNLLPLPEWT